MVVDDTGQTLFPAFGVKTFRTDHGNKKLNVGFIGEVLKDTPTIVTPTGVAGLTFQDEADAANRAVANLRQKGVDTSILVIHQGGVPDVGARRSTAAPATWPAARSQTSRPASTRRSRSSCRLTPTPSTGARSPPAA